jgi:outer membrane receptor for ferrienterochelin and colicins
VKLARILAAGAIALLLAVSPARGDDASEARLQYEIGNQLYKQKRFPEAVERLIASNRLVPNANVVFNIASIYVLLGKRDARRDPTQGGQWYVEAFNWTETFLGMASSDSDRRDGQALRDSLLKSVAVVAVETEPAGADIFIDRRSLGSVGHSPRRVGATGGDHLVLVQVEGYRPVQVPVVARTGAEVPVRVVLERITGTVEVQASPPGARLQFLPGSVELTGAPARAKVPVGSGRVVASLDGFVAQSREVTIRDGQTTRVELTLEPTADRSSHLSVSGQPRGAQVRLGGREVGRLPLTLPGLGPGPQTLEISQEEGGYQPWKGELLLEAGATTRVDAALVRPRDRAWTGWKWLGYGAGGVLLGVGGAWAIRARVARDEFFASPSTMGMGRVNSLNRVADALLAGGAITLATTALIQALSGPPPGSRAEVRTTR